MGDRNMSKYKNIQVGVLLAVIALLSVLIYLKEPYGCLEEAVILDIVSVSGRDATVFTTKGTFTRNQDTFKDGDTICIKHGEIK